MSGFGGIQLRPDVLYCSKRSAQNSDAPFFRRTIRTTKPDLCVRIDGSSFVEEGFVPAGDTATPVPDLGLAGIDPNAAVLPQLLTQNPVDRHNPLWLCNGIHIIVESQESLVWTEARLHRSQSLVLPESIQHGHKRIALLSSFSLPDLVGLAIIVVPQVGRRIAKKLHHKWEHRVTAWVGLNKCGFTPYDILGFFGPHGH